MVPRSTHGPLSILTDSAGRDRCHPPRLVVRASRRYLLRLFAHHPLRCLVDRAGYRNLRRLAARAGYRDLCRLVPMLVAGIFSV